MSCLVFSKLPIVCLEYAGIQPLLGWLPLTTWRGRKILSPSTWAKPDTVLSKMLQVPNLDPEPGILSIIWRPELTVTHKHRHPEWVLHTPTLAWDDARAHLFPSYTITNWCNQLSTDTAREETYYNSMLYVILPLPMQKASSHQQSWTSSSLSTKMEVPFVRAIWGFWMDLLFPRN